GSVVMGILHLKQDRESLAVAGLGLLQRATAASHPAELRQGDALALPVAHLATEYQALAKVALGLIQQVAMLRHFAQLIDVGTLACAVLRLATQRQRKGIRALRGQQASLPQRNLPQARVILPLGMAVAQALVNAERLAIPALRRLRSIPLEGELAQPGKAGGYTPQVCGDPPDPECLLESGVGLIRPLALPGQLPPRPPGPAPPPL